ncbi:MAG: hypothetical protein ACYC2G_15800 [Gemmatimonadaceae bacterium]
MPPASAAPLVVARRAAARAIALLVLPLLALPAQRATGAGADAVVLPRGVLRVSVQGQLDAWGSRYESDVSGAPLTSSSPLGARFSSDDLGSARVGGLTQLETRLRALTGLDALQLSLGDVQLRAEARRSTIPVRLELGLGRRLQLSAMIPYVQTRVEMSTIANRTGERGNVGSNPALTDAAAADANAALVNRLRASVDALDTALAGCTGGAASPVCADQDAARATSASTAAFASELAAVYGLPDGGGEALVPRIGSEAAAAIGARIAALRSSYGAYGFQFIGEDAAPAGATQPVTGADLASTLGAMGVPTPGNAARYGIGDIEVGARLLLFDGFGGDIARATTPTGITARASIDGLVRLGTGKPSDPDRLLDVGTGDGQMDVEVGAVADLIFGRRFWASAAARYGVQLEGDQTVRVPSPGGESYVNDANRALVRRDPGDYMELELTPRVSLGEFVSLSASYRFRHRDADALELADAAPGAAPLPLDVLARSFEGDEHRLGLGLTVSTVAAYAAGRVNMPLDISYVHSRTVAGSGMATPKLTRDEVMLRIYLSVFGRGR